MEDNAMIDKICQAQALAANGDHDGARALYADLWEKAIRAEDQYQACVVAHFMAHAYFEPVTQLAWHLRALRAADIVNDERVHTFYPSLYANLGEVYLRLGNSAQACKYIARARETEHVLQEDGYGRMIRSLIVRIERDAGCDNGRE